MRLIKLPHADPAELVLTPPTRHMVTAALFFNARAALRAIPNPSISLGESLELRTSVVLLTVAIVLHLVAEATHSRPTVLTCLCAIVLVLLHDLATLGVWAPEQIWIHIDLLSQLRSLVLSLHELRQILHYLFLFDCI